MSLYTDIKDEIKEALKAKDTPRLEALRGVVSAFTNELIKLGKKPNDEVTDELALSVITRSVKSRRDSILAFKNAGRDDLVKEEEDQIVHLEKFLPKMMERNEVEKIAKDKKEELGIDDKTKSGMLMSALMKDLKGRADGNLVKEVVDNLFE